MILKNRFETNKKKQQKQRCKSWLKYDTIEKKQTIYTEKQSSSKSAKITQLHDESRKYKNTTNRTSV